jgi:bifunctional DNA-binding transcriptional regulator/antitoxin component of YhaV-PrlF toxin-antitoxin module
MPHRRIYHPGCRKTTMANATAITTVQMDKEGRVRIPKNVREYLEINEHETVQIKVTKLQ